MTSERKGYFSLLRWRSDTTRDEARNVAIILVDEVGKLGGVRRAPLSGISPRLREQGILDSILVSIEDRFREEVKPDLSALTEWQKSLNQAVYLTEPEPTAIPDPEEALNALYKAYVAPRGGGPRSLTKGLVLDQTTDLIRRQGYVARRGEYVDDFLFDLAVEGLASRPFVLDVLSFANSKQGWTTDEHDAGHFLYALDQTGLSGAAVIQPPSQASRAVANTAFERVRRWFDRERIPHIAPPELSVPGRLRELAVP